MVMHLHILQNQRVLKVSNLLPLEKKQAAIMYSP